MKKKLKRLWEIIAGKGSEEKSFTNISEVDVSYILEPRREGEPSTLPHELLLAASIHRSYHPKSVLLYLEKSPGASKHELKQVLGMKLVEDPCFDYIFGIIVNGALEYLEKNELVEKKGTFFHKTYSLTKKGENVVAILKQYQEKLNLPSTGQV